MTTMTTRTTPTPANVIEAARVERGMSKSELARRIGMPRETLSRALHGHPLYRLSGDRLQSAAAVLGIPAYLTTDWFSSTSNEAA